MAVTLGFFALPKIAAFCVCAFGREENAPQKDPTPLKGVYEIA